MYFLTNLFYLIKTKKCYNKVNPSIIREVINEGSIVHVSYNLCYLHQSINIPLCQVQNPPRLILIAWERFLSMCTPSACTTILYIELWKIYDYLRQNRQFHVMQEPHIICHNSHNLLLSCTKAQIGSLYNLYRFPSLTLIT